ncbi:MAG TPA: tyrosine-type recombinase/integrase [Dehalococcoidia bacterium]|nr:tyrosine-type recombinase/integrase [Dehalococcoidia bacterium]
MDCGLRVTELVTIKLKNIDFLNASILVNGKGGKSRTVYLSDTTVNHLRQYINKSNKAYLKAIAKRTIYSKRKESLSSSG